MIPLEFDMTNTNQITVFGFWGSQQVLTTPTGFQLDKSTNTITYSSCTKYVQSNIQDFVTIKDIILPDYTKETTSVKIYLTTSGDFNVA